ncbi:MAG: ribosomal-protein-alanine N-acetyltransferase [Oceanicoccus sp.]|jgi:ribosomal-protein-alanine N-acetyltransferase
MRMDQVIAIERLIRSEQEISNGEFISEVEINSYIRKLKTRAEFVTHYTNGVLSGFIAFYCNDPGKQSAFITLVLLARDYRGMGVASIMLEDVLSICKTRDFQFCELEVESNNSNAIALYKKFGFQENQKKASKYLMRASLMDDFV